MVIVHCTTQYLALDWQEGCTPLHVTCASGLSKATAEMLVIKGASKEASDEVRLACLVVLTGHPSEIQLLPWVVGRQFASAHCMLAYKLRHLPHVLGERSRPRRNEQSAQIG
jgi:hypothetical protein